MAGNFFERKKRKGRMVVRSVDFLRVASLPRRETFTDFSEALTLHLKTPGGTQSLRPHQAWALSEAYERGGLLAPLSPGAGKTLISLLAPVVMDAQRPLLLVPAALRDKTLKIDIPALRHHWRLHDRLLVRSYEELSTVGFADFLNRTMPDLIICDEVHNLRARSAARTKRVLRFYNEHPTTKFIGMSGTITKRSLRDYAHLLRLALKDGSPLPHSWMELQDWADALDEGIDEATRIEPGALMDFVEPEDMAISDKTARARRGFRRRLVVTPGVVTTEETSISTALNILERPVPQVAPEIVSAFRALRNTATLPGGEEISTALDLNRHAKELAAGFYYRWVWPEGKVDHEWLEARKLWRRFVRKTVQYSRGYDTELQVAQAVRKGEIRCPEDEYQKWTNIKDRVEPRTEAVWISEYLIDDIAEWLREGPGIAWVEHQAVAEKLRQRGFPVFAAGENEIALEDGSRAVVASMAHHVGKNLQMFNRNLVVSSPTSGTIWEQMIARTHRPGQDADEVIFNIYLHCRELWGSFMQAQRDSEYIFGTLGQEQRLRIATKVFPTVNDVFNRVQSKAPLWAESGFADLEGPQQRTSNVVDAAAEAA